MGGGEKSLSPHLPPVLLPTLFADRTGVQEPFSQHQLLSGFSSYRTTHPSKVPAPPVVPVNMVRQSPTPFTSSSGVEAVSSIAGHQTAPQLAVGFSALLLLVTSLKYSEQLRFVLIGSDFCTEH